MIESILSTIACHTPFSNDEVEIAYKITKSIDKTIFAIDISLNFNISLVTAAYILILKE